MPKAVETVLTSLGIPAEDVTAILGVAEADEATFDATPYADKVKTNYQTQFKNDPEFFSGITVDNLPPAVKKALESGQYARATNVTKAALAKSLGFSAEEIKDLEVEDFKALDFYVPAIVEKWTKTKATDKQLQADLIEARKKLEAFGPDYEKGIESKYATQAEQKIATAIFNANLVSELSAIPGLKIAASDIAVTAANALSTKYAFEKVGDFSVELRQLANPQMKVLKAGSSQELTLKDAMIELATERGWVEAKVDPKDNKGGGKIAITPDNKGSLSMVAPHVQDKLSRKIAEEA